MSDHQLLIRDLLLGHAARRSGREIVDAEGTRVGYPALIERIGRVAGALREAGVGPGQVVAVMDWDSRRYLEAYFAVPMIGATLQTVNVRLSPDHLAYTLDHAGAETLLVHDDFLPLLESIAPRLRRVRRIVTVGESAPAPRIDGAAHLGSYHHLVAAADPVTVWPEFDERTRATLFYTSGTTGLPKGVFYSHRQLVLHTLAALATFGTAPEQGRLSTADVYMPITPMFHAHAWSFPYALTAIGAKQVYPGRYDAGTLLDLIEREGVTFTHCVATVLQLLLDHPRSAAADLSGVKMLIGGSALPDGLARRALARGVDLFTGYGMSETGPLQTINHLSPDELRADPADQPRLRSRPGRPILLCDVQTSDGSLRPTPPGVEGEITFRSPWLTAGYLHDEPGSAALWEGGRLHSGDVGRFDGDGVLHITDRLKDVIKTGGEWVSSLQLESLISQVQGVAEAAVIAAPDPKWGERPLALVRPADGAEGLPDAVRDHLVAVAATGAIPRYAVPERVLVVDALERTSVGKLDKRALRDRHLDRNREAS